MVYCEKSNLGGSTPLTFDQHETVLALEPLVEPWILKPSFVLNLLNICCICEMRAVSILCWDLNPIWLWAMSYIYTFEGSPTLRHTHTHTNNISDTKAFLERPTNKNGTSPWSCGGSWVPSDVRIGAFDGVGGKGSHVYFISWANDGNQDVNKSRTSGGIDLVGLPTLIDLRESCIKLLPN